MSSLICIKELIFFCQYHLIKTVFKKQHYEIKVFINQNVKFIKWDFI